MTKLSELTARLTALAQEFKQIKLSIAAKNLPPTTSNDKLTFTKEEAQDINAKVDKFDGIKDKTQLDKAGKMLAEELKNLIPAFLAKYASASEGQQKQLAGVKAKAEAIMKNISAYKYAIKRTYNIEPLRNTKNNIDNNQRLQTYNPTEEDLLLLADAITEITNWLRDNRNPAPELLEQIQAETIIVKKWGNYYKSLSNNCARRDDISLGTQETISTTIDILANNELDDTQKAIAVNYLQDLQFLAACQVGESILKEEIRLGLSRNEMKNALLDKGELEGNIVGALIFVEDTPTILVAQNTPNAEATKLHEMQHLIQYSKGDLAFSNGKTFNWVYDIYDEVEAYKVQYLVAPNSMPSPIQSIDEITPAYLSEWYPKLPHTKLSLNSTLITIQTAFDVHQLEDGPKDLLPARTWENDSQLTLKEFFEMQNALVARLGIKYKK